MVYSITKRKTKCKICRTEFFKRSISHKVCGKVECAVEFAQREREKQERKELRARKESIKTRRDYLKEAQKWFNSYIRERDKNKPCICCGQPLGQGSIGGGFDAGHYRSVGSAPHLRFDEANCHGQRKQCNRYASGRAVDYRIGLIERIGIEEVERLESDQSLKKWSKDDLVELIAIYRKKSREMKIANSNLCKIDGCNGPVDYIEQGVCQKHYFRFMRYGTYDTTMVGKGKERIITPNGYVRLLIPDHPLAVNRYVFEHRKIVYDKYGENLPICEICGNTTSWKTCHIDHIDNNKQNNDISNLRPLCRGCNTFRDYPPQYTIRGNHSITIDGITKTPHEWSKLPNVKVSSGTIIRRKSKGMSDYDAVFSEKKTHKFK